MKLNKKLFPTQGTGATLPVDAEALAAHLRQLEDRLAADFAGRAEELTRKDFVGLLQQSQKEALALFPGDDSEAVRGPVAQVVARAATYSGRAGADVEEYIAKMHEYWEPKGYPIVVEQKSGNFP